jgi:hypothetical protein
MDLASVARGDHVHPARVPVPTGTVVGHAPLLPIVEGAGAPAKQSGLPRAGVVGMDVGVLGHDRHADDGVLVDGRVSGVSVEIRLGTLGERDAQASEDGEGDDEQDQQAVIARRTYSKTHVPPWGRFGRMWQCHEHLKYHKVTKKATQVVVFFHKRFEDR